MVVLEVVLGLDCTLVALDLWNGLSLSLVSTSPFASFPGDIGEEGWQPEEMFKKLAKREGADNLARTRRSRRVILRIRMLVYTSETCPR